MESVVFPEVPDYQKCSQERYNSREELSGRSKQIQYMTFREINNRAISLVAIRSGLRLMAHLVYIG
jgi:hypothetical protein